MFFKNHEASHTHSLEVLNALYEYDDFMESVDTLIDLGCGAGLDLEWWATRTTRDDDPIPLNIKCVGMDVVKNTVVTQKYPNATFQLGDFEDIIHQIDGKNYDVLWSHDSFQYALSPLTTLKKWYNIANEGAMLSITIPHTTNYVKRQMDFYQSSGCYYHHTLVSLIHMLASTGWDCGAGFFQKKINDPWINAIVYRSDIAPADLKNTSWYTLADMGLLPKCAVDSVNKHGYLKQTDLLLPWIDKSLTHYGLQ